MKNYIRLYLLFIISVISIVLIESSRTPAEHQGTLYAVSVALNVFALFGHLMFWVVLEVTNFFNLFK